MTLTTGYVLYDIAYNWINQGSLNQYLYDRNMLRMLIDRLKMALGIEEEKDGQDTQF